MIVAKRPQRVALRELLAAHPLPVMAQGWLGLLPLIDSPPSTTDLPR